MSPYHYAITAYEQEISRWCALNYFDRCTPFFPTTAGYTGHDDDAVISSVR